MDYLHYSNFIVITILLTILSLTLSNWHPPIQKKQYIVISLLSVGALLGWHIINSWAYGVCLAGLVFFKNELTSDFQKTVNSFKKILNIGKEIDK
ncbi:MAG: hypothetical protein [Malazfec virus 1]